MVGLTDRPVTDPVPAVNRGTDAEARVGAWVGVDAEADDDVPAEDDRRPLRVEWVDEGAEMLRARSTYMRCICCKLSASSRDRAMAVLVGMP